MKRRDLEHLIRAAGAISESTELIIIGSQAILGMFPDPPEELIVSQEADLYPADDPSKADLIDGTIGELSPFHEQFGYYAHGVGPETAILPSHWKSRLIKIQNENTLGVAGLCLHPVDVAVSKLIAGRQRDFDFVDQLIRHRLVALEDIESVLSELPANQAVSVKAWLQRRP
ncbi:hypothetical protein L0222_26455 [bacterium]|nr:hypothetical protein [bacterium]